MMPTNLPPDTELDAALAQLRSDSADLHTPLGVEQTLLAAFARQLRPRPWYRRLGAVSGLASAALATLLVLALPHGAPPAMPTAVAESGGEFIALDSAERIAQEPAPRLIETDVARAVLAPLGVTSSPDNAGELVRAQMLVGADGQPLALRLLNITHPQP